jgi:hypothetical protein
MRGGPGNASAERIVIHHTSVPAHCGWTHWGAVVGFIPAVPMDAPQVAIAESYRDAA